MNIHFTILTGQKLNLERRFLTSIAKLLTSQLSYLLKRKDFSVKFIYHKHVSLFIYFFKSTYKDKSFHVRSFCQIGGTKVNFESI